MDYQGNSHKAREHGRKIVEKPKQEKIVTGVVVEKKPGFGHKLKSLFFGGGFKGTLQFVAADVLLPAVRNLFVDTVEAGARRAVYGESASARRRGLGPQYGSRIQYNSPLHRERNPAYLPDQPSRLKPIRRDTNDFILSTREEAEHILERLLDIVSQYEVASLADLYDLAGLPSSPVDNKWGWSYLNNAEIRQVREGYLLDLPPTEEI